MKAAEDKTFPGAVAAALASPWGQAVSAGDPANTYFGSYREVFARDLYEAWTAMMVAGDRATARAMTRFLFERQQLPDGSMPRNSLTNGKPAPDSFNTQLDECAYPLVMALAVGLTSPQYYRDHIVPAANFVATRGPSFGPERWEEQSGFSPSTIAAEIAGLLAAAQDRADQRRRPLGARVAGDRRRVPAQPEALDAHRPTARSALTRTSSACRRPAIPNAATSTTTSATAARRSTSGEIIDAGFLEYARLGVLAEDDPDLVRSLDIVDATIRRTTDTGVGFYRYNGDGYGDGVDRRAPVGALEHGQRPSVAGAGRRARAVGARPRRRRRGGRAASRRCTARRRGVGLIPEQAWELADLARSPFGTDPTIASIGFENGKAAGSASALTWSAGQFVRLMRDVSAGRDPRPAALHDPALRQATRRATTALTVTAPADESRGRLRRSTSPAPSAPGNTITVAATNIDPGPPGTTLHETTAGAGGAFSLTVPLTGGTTMLNITATSPSGATARTARTVVFDFVPGTLLYEAADPLGDDNGPGNYAYPTSDNFKPGAYDIEQFQVFDAGDRIIFRLRTQGPDADVREPARAPSWSTSTSTCRARRRPRRPPSFPQRKYEIAAGGAWSRLIEVQGFGRALRRRQRQHARRRAASPATGSRATSRSA